MTLEEHGREVGERIRAIERERLEALMGMHPLCPADGLPGAYVGLIGSFGTARLTFVCPNQDAFTYNPNTGHEWLIPPDDHKFIHLESFDLLKSDEQMKQIEQPEMPSQ
jgi:hypothetical protein